MTLTKTHLRTWLKLCFITFLLLLLIHLALPALLLLFQVPSFAIGDQVQILRWQNDKAGSGLQFNLLFLLGVAVLLSLFLMLTKTRRKHIL